MSSPLYTWWLQNPGPGGIIVHECLPKSSGTFLDPILIGDNCGVASVTNNWTNTNTLNGATFPVGTTNVVWTAIDSSGNPTSCNYDVVVVDNQPPTITCPADVTVYMNTGCTATGVDLGVPVTADNCSVFSVANNGLVAYPEFTTVVTWTVTDASGNTATCTQNVTVLRNSLGGTVKYPNNLTPLNGVVLTLVETGATSTVTGGNYSFPGLCAGTFTITAATTKTVGGINATDAAQVNAWGVGPHHD